MSALNEIIDKRLLIFITNEVVEYYNFLGITFQTIDRFNVIIIAVHYVISNLATNVIHCFYHVSILFLFKVFAIYRASDISRKKKQNFAGFSGANSRKNQPISRDFRGKKVKIRGKIGRFRGILAQKGQISKDFQGQSLRKIGRFHGKFRGKTSPRNNQ